MHHAGLHEDEIGGKAYDARLLKRFASFVSPYRMTVAGVLLSLPLVSICRLLQPLVIKQAIDLHIMTSSTEGLGIKAALYLLLLIGESSFAYMEVYLLQSVGQKVMADIRQRLYDHILRLPARWFDRSTSGGIVTRLTNDIEALGEMFSSGLITVVGDVLLLAGIICIMLWMDVKLSLVTFTVLPPLVYAVWSFRKRMRLSYRETRARLARMNSFLSEAVKGMQIIQCFNRERDEQARFTGLNAAHRDSAAPVILWDASLYAVVEVLSSVAVGLIIWYGGGETVRGAITFGSLVAFIQYAEKFFGPIRDLSGKYSVMQGAMAALERIFAVLDESREESAGRGQGRDDAPSVSVRTVSERALIEFRHVTFSYRSGEQVLNRFNLKVGKGEKVALVGSSGGGKTTVTRLLTGMYEDYEGEILLDGVEIRSLPKETLRRRVGIVLQDAALFAGTVEFNICLGDEGAAEQVKKAASTVGADRFIEKMPGGFKHELRERGGNISLGERQLISFARAVAFDPEIILLDEATATVDHQSEIMIQEGMKKLMHRRTALVIAHRLSTIRDADRIAVISRGMVAEQGTHDELVSADGMYARLCRLQFGGC